MVVLTKGNIMKMHKKRGILAAASAVLTALALTMGGAASAAPANPPATSDVTITKLTQPDAVGTPADGSQISIPQGSEGIADVTFEYTLVPGTAAGETNDVGTNIGQVWAAAHSIDDLRQLVGATPTGTFPATSASGETTIDDLPRGLYIIHESIVPAGVTPAADFVLSVPLTDATNKDTWLDHIYVYPKNSKISGEKTVVDGEGGVPNFVVGGKITWNISADIPRVANDAPAATDRYKAPDAFEIRDTLDDAQLTSSEDEIIVLAPANLVKGVDYTVTPDTVSEVGKTIWTIAFTQDGRDKLANAINADVTAKIEVELITTVEAADEITNSASIYPDQKTVTGEIPPLEVPGTTVKYGTYQLVKKSSDANATAADLAGAEFRVYLSEADALAGTNAVTTKENPAGLWTTDNGGTVTVGGLRYSNWADGDTATGLKIQTYWLVETKALEGHQLLGEPVEFIVDENSATQTSQEIINAKTEGGAFELPLTGGTGTAMLTIGGVLLLAAVLVVARRRRVDDIA